jgi:hypothetical protein
MGAHINERGEFQSDKYPTTPAGKVPLSVKDPTAQDLLWTYAQRRRVVDSEFADDLETALRSAGHRPVDERKYLVDSEGYQHDDERAAWQHASRLLTGGDPSEVTPAMLERYVDDLNRVAVAARAYREATRHWPLMPADAGADARLDAALAALPKEE